MYGKAWCATEHGEGREGQGRGVHRLLLIYFAKLIIPHQFVINFQH